VKNSSPYTYLKRAYKKDNKKEKHIFFNIKTNLL